MLTTSQGFDSEHNVVKKNIKKACHLPKLTMVQKTFGSYKPVNEESRFKRNKADSGVDPIKTLTNFMNKDLIKPLRRDPLIIEPKYIQSNPLKWSIGCTKKCNSPLLLPKEQQYKDYTYSTSTNPTDSNKMAKEADSTSVNSLIFKGLQNPNINVKANPFSFLDMKSRYGFQTESKDSWKPSENTFTVSNRSSVPYDIINWNKSSEVLLKNSFTTTNMLNRNLNNKRKGVAEFSDHARLFNPNFNKDYPRLITENPKLFNQFNGVFSNLYDAAHKNGNIYVPFRRNYSDVKHFKSLIKSEQNTN